MEFDGFLWFVTPSGWIEIDQRFSGFCCLHILLEM
jgi:hypothetical protein